ncbi:SurA N-terminal domain-containing protein [Suttonella sp. R2A3]|uniref:SurA N-terminal domain-containing protein n=1 Tax=Suttonella sp. R2A3 TaxID=2908648 RepID=UPI001F20A38E|nr:SurA N-terminal domain-containing protein [Suttonella sp. R2A3]UJF23726.1 SurA N-terminal domain-containing protein [Suttonella sp. R2A3]
MLDNIREKKTSVTTYILVGLAGLGMLFLGVPLFSGGQGSTSIAEVNGENISISAFNNAAQNLRAQFPDAELATVERAALNQLINKQLFNQTAANSGYRYPDQALYNDLKAQFPDDASYKTFLERSGISAGAYENSLRNDLTARRYGELMAITHIDNPQIARQFAANFAQTRDVTLIRLPLAAAVSETSLSEEQISDYYNDHQQSYLTPDRVNIDYFITSVDDFADPQSISDEELAQARDEMQKTDSRRAGSYLLFDQQEQADNARAQLSDGTLRDSLTQAIDAGEISGEYGELNLHKAGEGISPAADKALFALDAIGDYSPVVETDYGYMIIGLSKIDAPEALGDGALRAQIANKRAEETYLSQTNQAFDAAQNGTALAQIATLLNQNVQNSDWFSAERPPQDWMSQPEVSEQLFGERALEAEEMAQPVAIDDQRSVFFTVTAREAAAVPELDTIHAQVSDDARQAAAREALEDNGNAVLQAWKDDPQALDELISAHQGERLSYQGLSFTDENSALDEAVLQQIFQQNARDHAFFAPNGDYLISHLDAVHTPAVDGEINNLDQWTSLWQRTSQDLFAVGLTEWLRDNAKISVNQDVLSRSAN